jgi:hypothetical protein
MRLKVLSAASTIALTFAVTGVFAPDVASAKSYTVVKRFHQSAATNREEADITVIRCSGGRQYYIYGYYRSSGPRYRAIIPPYWGNPVGGRDHYQFEQAVRAACY